MITSVSYRLAPKTGERLLGKLIVEKLGISGLSVSEPTRFVSEGVRD